jgi:hypothetical protein
VALTAAPDAQDAPGRWSPPRACKRPTRSALAALALAALALASAAVAPAQPPADLLPFRLAFGRPMYSPDGETAAYLWIQGGRIRLRFATDGAEHRFAGELRTDRDGLFEDVLPTGENVRIRQLRPGKIFFEAQTTAGDAGLDVTLGGTFDQLTIDLRVDGEQRANLLRIGEDKRTPAALPARLELRKASPAWIERFGF